MLHLLHPIIRYPTHDAITNIKCTLHAVPFLNKRVLR